MASPNSNLEHANSNDAAVHHVPIIFGGRIATVRTEEHHTRAYHQSMSDPTEPTLAVIKALKLHLWNFNSFLKTRDLFDMLSDLQKQSPEEEKKEYPAVYIIHMG